MPTFLVRSICLASLVTVIAASRSARAQSSDEIAAARSALLDDAQRASTQGDHARALALAQRAGRLRMTPSLRMFISSELLALGQFAPALGSAETCVREADRDASTPSRAAILDRCRALVEESRARVGQIVIRIPDPAPSGLTVTVNGTELPEALWGAPYVVTPGAIAIEASAPGRDSFHASVPVAAHAAVEVRVVMAARAVEENRASAAPLAHETATTVTTSSAAPPRVETHATPAPLHLAPLGVAAAGAVIAAGSSVFFVLRANSMTACPTLGGNLYCADMASFQRAQQGTTWTVVADSMLAAGVAIAAAGAVWWAVSPRVHRSEVRARAALAPTRDGVFAFIEVGL